MYHIKNHYVISSSFAAAGFTKPIYTTYATTGYYLFIAIRYVRIIWTLFSRKPFWKTVTLSSWKQFVPTGAIPLYSLRNRDLLPTHSCPMNIMVKLSIQSAINHTLKIHLIPSKASTGSFVNKWLRNKGHSSYVSDTAITAVILPERHTENTMNEFRRINHCLHIEATTKWPPCRRRHIQCFFLNENVCISLKISLEFVP